MNKPVYSINFENILILLFDEHTTLNAFNFYLDQLRYFKLMSKYPAKGAPAAKTPASQPKAPEKKVWRAEDYATLTIPIE